MTLKFFILERVESLANWFSLAHPFTDFKTFISDACFLDHSLLLMIYVSDPYKSVGVAIAL